MTGPDDAALRCQGLGLRRALFAVRLGLARQHQYAVGPREQPPQREIGPRKWGWLSALYSNRRTLPKNNQERHAAGNAISAPVDPVEAENARLCWSFPCHPRHGTAFAYRRWPRDLCPSTRHGDHQFV